MRIIPLSRSLAAAFLCLLTLPALAGDLDINKADASVLAQSLSGVGPVKAEAIVRFRKANGPFASADDLVKVPGIGQELIERNRAVFVTPAAGAASKAKSPVAK